MRSIYYSLIINAALENNVNYLESVKIFIDYWVNFCYFYIFIFIEEKKHILNYC